MTETSGTIRLPQIGRILEHPEIAAFFPRISRPLTVKTVAATVARIRASVLSGLPLPSGDAVVRHCIEDCRSLASRRLTRVLNATGILLHTNLGRSPLGRKVWERAAPVNTGYSNLEFDLESGVRGIRGGLAPELAALLAGAESALVVNNNAAAVLLVLGTVASGREVIVSRGEQVQIGGGFRIPEILAISGARLVEVGTTNVTTIDDYSRAVTPDTACALVVHTSNFAIRGFTEKPALAELVRVLAPRLPVIVDQGSGCTTERIEGEIPAARCIDAGAALVCFSGDKLLGGPQAGIIAGRADLVAACIRHPLMRAFRPGKTVLSLLEERLIDALSGLPAASAPRSVGELDEFGRSILALMRANTASLIPTTASAGGGTSPDSGFPSLALRIDAPVSPSRLLAALREGEPPVVGGVRDGKVRLDLSSLYGEEPGLIAELVEAALVRHNRHTRCP